MTPTHFILLLLHDKLHCAEIELLNSTSLPAFCRHFSKKMQRKSPDKYCPGFFMCGCVPDNMSSICWVYSCYSNRCSTLACHRGAGRVLRCPCHTGHTRLDTSAAETRSCHRTHHHHHCSLSLTGDTRGSALGRSCSLWIRGTPDLRR